MKSKQHRVKKPNVVSPILQFECPQPQVRIEGQTLVNLAGKPVVFDAGWNGALVHVIPTDTLKRLIGHKRTVALVTAAMNSPES